MYECGADLCTSVGPKQVSGIPSLNQISQFRCCMRDGKGDVTRMMAIQSCGLTLARLRVERAAGHSPRHSPCLPACASTPSSPYAPLSCSCVLWTPSTAPDSLTRTTFSRWTLYYILPACNCSIPCFHTRPGSGQPFPTSHTITSDVGCGFFRLYVWSSGNRLARGEAERVASTCSAA